MPKRFRSKHLSYDDIRSKAEGFLDRYHSERSIPVPIEEIIDLQLHLDIVPMPGLRRTYDCEAFITSDMEWIYVDDHTYRNVATRYRFTLAHEIAHAVLHQPVYRELEIVDLDSWKTAQRELDDVEYGWLEWQAYAFAGLVLVPPNDLRLRFEECVGRVRDTGVDPNDLTEPAMRMICGYLAREFDVSTQVVEKRINKDGLVA